MSNNEQLDLSQEREPSIEQEQTSELFYSGIEDNNLYFHGTGNQESLESIVEGGLEPPHISSASDATLSKNYLYSSNPRYAGGFGALLMFHPEDSDLGYNPAGHNTRSTNIDRYNEHGGKLPTEALTCYIPGDETGNIEDEIHNLRDLAHSENPTPEQLQHQLQVIAETAQNTLDTVGQFPNPENDTVETKQKIAQEIAWNSLNQLILRLSDDIRFANRFTYDEKYGNFEDRFESQEDLDKVKRDLSALNFLEQQKGIGLENVESRSLSDSSALEEAISQQEQAIIQKQVEQDKVQSTSRIRSLLNRLRRT